MASRGKFKAKLKRHLAQFVSEERTSAAFRLAILLLLALLLSSANLFGAEDDGSGVVLVSQGKDAIELLLEKEEREPTPIIAPAPVEPIPEPAIQRKSQPVKELPPFLGNKVTAPEEENSEAETTEEDSKSLYLSTYLGKGWFSGRWKNAAKNIFIFGATLDLPLFSLVSIEVEGAIAKHRFQFRTIAHPFYEFNVGGSLKLAPSVGFLRPYVGGGFLSSYFDNIYLNPSNSDQWLGSFQAIGGVDLLLGGFIGIGVRASMLFPLVNKRSYPIDGNPAADVINSNQFRLMGTVTIGL